MFAGEPASAAPPAGVPEIVVEASPVDRNLPARTVLPPTDVGNLGKNDLADVLDFAPGMNVRIGGRGEPRIDVRGFDQRATLFTLDGVPVYEPWNGIVNVNLFPAELLDRILLTRGATSTLYGPNGMAGAIHLSTRPDAPGRRARASTTWRDSNFWDTRTSLAVNHRRTSLLLGGRSLDSKGFPLSGDFGDRPESQRRFEDGGRRRNSDRNEWSAFVNGAHRLSDRTIVRATWLESRATLGIPPRTTSFTPQIRRAERQDLRHLHAALDDRDGDGNEAGLALFYSGYTTLEEELAADIPESVLSTIDTDSEEVGALARGARAVGSRLVLALASQVRHARANVGDTATGLRVEPDVTTISFAAESQYAATDRLNLVAGLSGDVQTGGGRGTEWEPNPQVGATYDFGRWGSARAAVSRKTRFPTLRELFDPLQGNDDLEAEKSWVYELGWAGAIAEVDVDLALFRADVDDLIESSGGRSGDPSPAVNLTDAVLQGFEVALAWRPVEQLGLRLNYTFLDAEADNRFTDDPDDTATIQHRPKHRVNAIAEAALPGDFGARLEAQYTAEQVDRFGTSVKLGDVFLLNAQLANVVVDGIQLLAGVDNLLDEDYEEALGMPRPGRWLYVGVRLRADDF